MDVMGFASCAKRDRVAIPFLVADSWLGFVYCNNSVIAIFAVIYTAVTDQPFD